MRARKGRSGLDLQPIGDSYRIQCADPEAPGAPASDLICDCPTVVVPGLTANGQCAWIFAKHHCSIASLSSANSWYPAFGMAVSLLPCLSAAAQCVADCRLMFFSLPAPLQQMLSFHSWAVNIRGCRPPGVEQMQMLLFSSVLPRYSTLTYCKVPRGRIKGGCYCSYCQ
jgi:hypothetical protein